MEQYQFESEDFALSESGVHLLRNRFNFQTIPYSEVKNAAITRSHEIKRPFIVLLLGIVLLGFAGKQTMVIWQLFHTPGVTSFYIESVVVIILPALLGAYCLYAFLRKGPMLRIETNQKVYSLRLRSFYKNNQQTVFKQYLNEKLNRVVRDMQKV